MEQEAPPVRTMLDVWDLIIGPQATPWSSLLVHDHLGSGGRLALFQTCTASRDTVLSAAEQATLKVAANLDGQAASMRASAKALVTRGKLPTKLHLTASASDKLSSVLGALEAGTTWLDGLCVQCDQTLPRHALALVGRCCPRLRVLDITTVRVHELPSCELFPNLQQLDSSQFVYLQPEGFYRSAAPYIKQLTHLSMWSSPHLRLVFGSGTVGTHLCNLHLRSTDLDDELLGLLLQSAPALEELRVSALHLQSDVHVHSQAQWRKVTFDSLWMSSLAHLPVTPPSLVLMCIRGELTLVCDVASMDEAVAARLKDVQFRWKWKEGSDATVFLDNGVAEDQEPAALRLGLTFLRSWSPEEDQLPLDTFPDIVFESWTMTAEVMLELQGLPRWKEFYLDMSLAWLPAQPQLYETLLGRLPDSYCDVTISCVSLEADPTAEQVESICLGAPVNRTVEAPLRITLANCPGELFESIQHSMQLHPLPNVVVAKGTDGIASEED